jgi:hypothetical protein
VKEDLIEHIKDLEERFTPTGTTRANTEEDEILGELMEIFEGKTGSGLDEEMEDLKAEARERYESKQPPGYEDYDGEDELCRGECEDFLIWKQLMEFAEREGKDIVFITGEEKPDWWEVDREHSIIRPTDELLREFGRETEQVFWMLTTEDMIDAADDRLGVDVKPKSAKQTTKISVGVGDEKPAVTINEIGDLISAFSDLSECLKDARHNVSESRRSVSETIISDAKRHYENAIGKDKKGILDKEKTAKIALGLNEIEEGIDKREREYALKHEKGVRAVTNQILERLADKRPR